MSVQCNMRGIGVHEECPLVSFKWWKTCKIKVFLRQKIIFGFLFLRGKLYNFLPSTFWNELWYPLLTYAIRTSIYVDKKMPSPYPKSRYYRWNTIQFSFLPACQFVKRYIIQTNAWLTSSMHFFLAPSNCKATLNVHTYWLFGIK